MSLNLRNIISMEDHDFEDVTPSVAEAAADEVEAIEATEEFTEEAAAMDNYSEELDETVEDLDELEETRESLETALDDPDYEGIDEVAAEAIGQRLRSISKRRGFDISEVEGVFSAETFNDRTSGRRRKTEIALEGIKDTLVKMWERVKAAIKAIWQAIKDFWKKHISTIGRLLKALEKTKRRARDINGNPTGEQPKAPSGVQKAFWVGTKNVITHTDVKNYIARMSEALKAGVTVLEGSSNTFKTIVDDVKDKENNVTGTKLNSTYALKDDTAIHSLRNSTKDGKLGTKEAPLVNGWFAKLNEDGMKESKKTFEFEWDQREVKPSDNRNIAVAGRNDMESLCEDTIKLIKATQRFGDNFNKASNEYDRQVNRLSQTLNNYNDESARDTREQITRNIRLLNDVARLLPKINTKLSGLNIAGARQVISFCNTCMSNYKENV